MAGLQSGHMVTNVARSESNRRTVITTGVSTIRRDGLVKVDSQTGQDLFCSHIVRQNTGKSIAPTFGVHLHM